MTLAAHLAAQLRLRKHLLVHALWAAAYIQDDNRLQRSSLGRSYGGALESIAVAPIKHQQHLLKTSISGSPKMTAFMSNVKQWIVDKKHLSHIVCCIHEIVCRDERRIAVGRLGTLWASALSNHAATVLSRRVLD